MWSNEEQERYARHLTWPKFGEAAQSRLRSGHIALVGCGGLGSPALLYLAAAGVGDLTFLDADVVSVSNLQRQILHATPDVGRLKVISADEKLRRLNPHVRLHPIAEHLTWENAAGHLASCDVVVDATDSFQAKQLVHSVCMHLGKVYIHASISGWCGQLFPVIPRQSACLRCLFPDWPQSTTSSVLSSEGPFGPLPGVVGTLQAVEAIHYLLGNEAFRTGELLTIDLSRTEFQRLRVHRNSACPDCGTQSIQKE